jgi:AcrR family transcriptional regulator
MAERRDVDDGIAESTLYLLRTGGPRAVTVEAVTARSGIAKTTIYRRYRHRQDMLVAALSRLISPEPLSLRAGTPKRFHWTNRQAVAAVDNGIGFGGFASLLTEYDPEFSTLFRQIPSTSEPTCSVSSTPARKRAPCAPTSIQRPSSTRSWVPT